MHIYADEITHHSEVEKRTHEVSTISTKAQQNNRGETFRPFPLFRLYLPLLHVDHYKPSCIPLLVRALRLI